MERARLYLDVDGCINLFGASPWPTGRIDSGVATLVHDGFGQVIEAGGWAASSSPQYAINWAPELIAELNQLDVDLVWLTTWCHNAPDLIAPMVGLTLESRVLEPITGKVSFPSIFWKCQALSQDLVEFDGKHIWIDDEPTPDDWAASSSLSGAFRIQPDPNFGITPEHIKAIKTHLAS